LAFVQGEGVEGGALGTAWGDYKPHLGSRPKTAHGTRMTGRTATAPSGYEFRGSSSGRPGTAGTPSYCRKCGKVRILLSSFVRMENAVFNKNTVESRLKHSVVVVK
jgi:hypothetical protein